MLNFRAAKKNERVFKFDMQPVSALDGFWRKLRSDIGLADVRLHDLHHNYASFAARSSETFPMIVNLLGHADIRTTARYSHLEDAHILAVADVVGAEIEKHIPQIIA